MRVNTSEHTSETPPEAIFVEIKKKKIENKKQKNWRLVKNYMSHTGEKFINFLNY